jgi:hypothetical protein
LFLMQDLYIAAYAQNIALELQFISEYLRDDEKQIDHYQVPILSRTLETATKNSRLKFGDIFGK